MSLANSWIQAQIAHHNNCNHDINSNPCPLTIPQLHFVHENHGGVASVQGGSWKTFLSTKHHMSY